MAALESDSRPVQRRSSISQASQSSQTAQEFIDSQELLEAEAREALPYQFDICTQPLGPLRQSLFSCLTCNPPPNDASTPYNAAGVCYSCSISCHGEHELVELFGKRNFVCDCGTTRLPETAPCTLRINAATGSKGNVHSEKAEAGNKYNQNFRNKFCSCASEYEANKENGTMYQCLGLGSVETGGCGEDWYHPECIMGLPRDWKSTVQTTTQKPRPVIAQADGLIPDPTVEAKDELTAENLDTAISNLVELPSTAPRDQNTPMDLDAVAEAEDEFGDALPGFPNEDDFEYFICYKCVDSNPWIKKYASTTGFLRPIFHDQAQPTLTETAESTSAGASEPVESKKRKALDEDDQEDQIVKKQRSQEESPAPLASILEVEPTKAEEVQPICRYSTLPPAPTGSFSLFTSDSFRDQLCRCPICYPILSQHPQLLEDEETYEPPLSTDGDNDAPGSLGPRSLLDRGEAALSNMDRVKAIEGVMVYNHLKDKVKSFLKPFAESGQPVGAEDIKKYFEGLRGDAEGIKEAGMKSNGSGDGSGDNRKEQSGY